MYPNTNNMYPNTNMYPIPNTNPILLIPDDEYGERSVSVSLDGDESELIFIDHTAGEMSVRIYIFII